MFKSNYYIKYGWIIGVLFILLLSMQSLKYRSNGDFIELEIAMQNAIAGTEDCENSSGGLCCNYYGVCSHPLGGQFDEAIWVSGECYCP